jgi:queuosine precursor transporter
MTARRYIVAGSFAGLLASVWAANYLVQHVGIIRVWPTDLRAPAGVYLAGVAFLFRDTVQRLAGVWWALLGIGLGAALSYSVSPTLAGASAAAFTASELTGLLVLWLLGRRLVAAIAGAQAAAAAVDSVVFLALAFGWAGVRSFFEGQFVAKVSVLALAYPVVYACRRYPRAGDTERGTYGGRSATANRY